MSAPILTPALDPTAELAVAFLQLAIARHLDEATFAIALADALGHTCATLDLREGRRDFPHRFGMFATRAEETYRRSMRVKRSVVTRDVHGRTI